MGKDPYAAIAEDPYAGIAEGAPSGPFAIKPTDPDWLKKVKQSQAAQPTSYETVGTDPNQELEHDYQRQGAVTRGIVGLNEAFGVPKAVSKNPSEAAKGIALSVMHPSLELDSLKQMYANMTESQQALIDRAYNLQHMSGFKNKQTGFALGVYSAIPVVGPGIVSALDRINTGDVAGGVGNLVGLGSQVFAPKIAEAAAKVLPTPPTAGELATSMRRTAQELTGSGPEATTEKLIASHKNAILDAETKQAEQNAATAKVNKDAAVNAYEEAQLRAQRAKTEAARKQAESDAATAKANRDAAVNAYEKAKLEGEQHAAAVQKQTQDLATRDALESQIQEKTQQYFDKESTAKAAAKQQENAAWEPWHKKAKDVQVSVEPLAKKVESFGAKAPEVRSVLSQLVPEPQEADANSLFAQDRQAVMKSLGYQGDYWQQTPQARIQIDAVTASNGLTPEPIDLDPAAATTKTLEDVHRAKSILGWKLARNEYPGPIAGEMKQVYNTLSQMEAQGSAEAGALDELTNARAETAKYQDAFGRVRPPRMTKEMARQKIANPDAFKAQQEEAIISGAASYDPSLVQAHREIQALRARLDAMPSRKTLATPITPPKGVPVTMQPREVVQPEPTEGVPFKAQPYKTVEKPKPPTVEDLIAKKKEIVRNRGTDWAKMNPWEFRILSGTPIATLVTGSLRGGPAAGLEAAGITTAGELAYLAGKRAVGSIFRSPDVINWIARPLPEEIQALNALPDYVKTDVRTKLHDFIEQAKRANPDVPIKIDPRIGRFLAGQVANQKPPGQQKKDIQAIQQKYQSSNPNLP